MTVVTGFEVLTSAYLGQDWHEYGTTADEVIALFLREEDYDDIRASIMGFEQLLASPMTEQEYYDRWVMGLHAGYDPRRDGLTFREWFAHALDVLRAAAPAPPDAPRA